MAASMSRVKSNENIQVYLRVRPMNARERSTRCHEAVEVTSNREVIVKHDHRSSKKFTFDRSFGPDSNQMTVYQSVVAPLIEEVLSGYNCTVFAYGQTGTGKTHTMIGEDSAKVSQSWDEISQVGIIPRSVTHLFEELRIMGVDFSMRISYLELYNEELTDLLATSDQTPVRIYDDNSKKGSIIVNGLEELPVHSSADVYKLLAKGQEKRKTAATLMNVQSSRSHTIFSILVHIREYNADGEEVLKVGKLNLVDLAGSENISKAGNEKSGIRTRETVNINQSLLTLGRVITALVERTPHVPYRESKLTRLLQESLGGRTKTSIIATISPGHRDLEETLSTLEYAHRAKNIQNKPEINQKLTKKLALKEYTEEIDKLKRDLMASRAKNGIYLAEESYNEMNCRLEAQKNELTEKQTTIKVLKDEVAKIQKVFNEVSLNLVEKETKLAETADYLHSTKAELGHTTQVLKTTNRRYHEKREILANHVQTEQVLKSQAEQLKNAADLASQDVYLLHDTLERRKLADRNIVSVSENFEQSMHTNIGDIALDFDNFNKQMDSESKMFVDHIVKSMAKNSGLSGEIREKLNEHRTTSDLNTNDVKKLIEEKMTGEMNFSAEQVELIKSTINQCVADERRSSEALSNVLRSLLSSIDNGNALQNQSSMLDMINAQRDLVTNFTTKQTARLQTLLTDATQLLTECRNSVDSAVTRNLDAIDKMTKLLDDVKCNTENMKTISPKLSESINTVTSATRNEIEEINKMQDEHGKCSVEQISSMTTIAAEVSRVIESVNNQTRLFAASMKSSKVRIREQFENHKTWAVTAFRNIERTIADGLDKARTSSSNIETVVNDADRSSKENWEKSSNFPETIATSVQSFSALSKKKLERLRNVVADFNRRDLKVYAPSGMTPAKREFSYPKALAATSPHDRIIKRFWAAHNDTSLDLSMSLSGNETAFMNGMNEVQSSSMVQMPNGLTSSPMNRPMEQERYETIMEVNDGEQTSEVAMSSTFMMPQSTPNRVLQEILVLNPNTPSPLTDTITVVKPPIENPSRDSNDEIPSVFDGSLGDSNKEN